MIETKSSKNMELSTPVNNAVNGIGNGKGLLKPGSMVSKLPILDKNTLIVGDIDDREN